MAHLDSIVRPPTKSHPNQAPLPRKESKMMTADCPICWFQPQHSDCQAQIHAWTPHQPFRTKAGTGARFEQCVQKMAHRKGVKDAKALCASIGRSKFGKS